MATFDYDKKENFTYDLNQRLTEVQQPNGKAITYDYNKLDALLTTTYEEEAEGTVLYAYDQDGRRVSMEDLTRTTTYEYDKDGRITGVKQGDGSVILYNYDTYIYNKDSSYEQYSGQAVIYTISKADGTVLTINAYNPFLITDGVGYKTKYEPCEELNSLGNKIHNNE